MEVNLLAVLLATLASMIVGFLWYGPLFGKIWIKLSNHKESEMDKSGVNKMYAMTAAALLLSI